MRRLEMGTTQIERKKLNLALTDNSFLVLNAIGVKNIRVNKTGITNKGEGNE